MAGKLCVMSHITVPDESTVTTFVVTTAQSVFSFPWTCFDKTDIQVLVGASLLLQSDFTFVGNPGTEGGFDGGTVTLVAAVSNVTVTIYRDIIVQRTDDFGAGPVSSRDRNTALDRLTAMVQDTKRIAKGVPPEIPLLPDAVQTVGNIVALRAALWPSGRPTQIYLVNNWSAGDGGGTFRWDAASTTTDDNGTIIKETAVTTGRWKRQENMFLDPRWFGAAVDARVADDGVGTGTTSVSSATIGFTSADVGKAVFLGPLASPLVTTIISVTNATTAVVGATVPIAAGIRIILGTDDTAEWQACLDFAETSGREIIAPNGWSVITAPLIYGTTAVITDPTAGRRSGLAIRGTSASASGMYAFHAGVLLDLRYGTADGVSTWLRIQGMAFHGPLRRVGSIGLKIDNCAYFEIENCDIAFFERQIVGTDILSGVFGECTIRLGVQGWEFSYSDFSRPNSITFRDCILATNYSWGGLATNAACIRIIGGSIEGNGIGLPLASTSAWGVKVVNCGTEGSIGLDVSGACYIEGNNGNADLWIDQQTNEALHNISASFLRYLSTQYVTQNILFTRDAARTASFVRVAGSAFKAANTYTEDAGRPYIFAPNATIIDGGSNVFTSATATPVTVFTPSFLPQFFMATPPPSPVSWTGRMIVVISAPGSYQILVSDGIRWKRVETNWSALSGDVQRTFTPLSTHREVTIFGTLTANRIVILDTNNAFGQLADTGETFVISRVAAGAFNTEVRNATAGGTLLATLTANQWAEFKFDGTSWSRFSSGTV